MINFSPACERNKQVIVEQLVSIYSHCSTVLEIGSGSGQHVLHFAQVMPFITWQPMDLADYLPGLVENLQQRPSNILAPIALDLSQQPWLPQTQFDGLFSANTLHIMSWQQVIGFFERADQQLRLDATMAIYGPFKYQGQFTSASNADFDLWLKQRDPLSGVRDFEAVVELAHRYGFSLLTDQAMPANNQLLSFQKPAKIIY